MRTRARLRFALTAVLATAGWPALSAEQREPARALVLQTDFGLQDHAVAAMRGVARLVAPRLIVEDLTHEIPPFDVWQAAYRLHAVVDYWPARTVFVSVVDPGVGTERASVVAKLAGGQLVVTPNNGTLTLLAAAGRVAAVRRIDENAHRLPGSEDSHTFHGRDLYAHVGALLASGRLAFAALGAATEAVLLPVEQPRLGRARSVGGIPVLDVRFGNVWTDLPSKELGLAPGEAYRVTIAAPGGEARFAGAVPFRRTFGESPPGEPLLYVNSLGNVALALNQGDFAQRFGVSSGPGWRVTIERTGQGEAIAGGGKNEMERDGS